MTKGVSLSWPSWAGIVIGLVSTAVTNYVLIMNRITTVEVRQEYVAKDFEKSEARSIAARTEMLNAIANLRTDIVRNGHDVYQTGYAAPAPAPASAAAEPPSAPQ